MHSVRLIAFACMGVLAAASMPNELAANTIQPEPHEVSLQQAPAMAQLPRTANNLPAMIVFGLLSLGTAVLLRRANPKEK